MRTRSALALLALLGLLPSPGDVFLTVHTLASGISCKAVLGACCDHSSATHHVPRPTAALALSALGGALACLAARAQAFRQRRAGRAVRAAQISSHRYRLDSRGITELPKFQHVPKEVAEAIRMFAEKFKDSPVVTWITGKRVQVYLLGDKSAAFHKYAEGHRHGSILFNFLDELKANLAEVADANDGEPSSDIMALVGAEEMQVPHTDLLPGQVQVIMALTPTRPTLVYDAQAQRPSKAELAKRVEVRAKDFEDDGFLPLFYKSYPLLLPVSDIYENMVHSYSGNFDAGDAVQIKDGIVHAGPECSQQPSDDPRIVIFMTYRTQSESHYDYTFQAKIWDWAAHPVVPPMVAYKRLLEVRSYAVKHGLTIEPWTYYPPQSSEACKMLCTTQGLDEDTVDLLVADWREVLYDGRLQVVHIDQNKAELISSEAEHDEDEDEDFLEDLDDDIETLSSSDSDEEREDSLEDLLSDDLFKPS